MWLFLVYFRTCVLTPRPPPPPHPGHVEGRVGRGSKRFREAVRFILAEFGPKPSHVDPIRGQNCGFGMYDMC